jgi:exodeoxyribonuclease V alpha subunit
VNDELVAKVTGVVFSNRTTGFVVLKALPDGDRSTISIRGSFPGNPLSVGLKARFGGKWEEHPTYGRQFSAQTCEIIPEKGRIGIIIYLSSHVPSIGPITAAKLYDAFGDDLVRVLEQEPDKIRGLSFLTRAQVDAILAEWRESSAARTTSIFLSDLGLNSAQVKAVYTQFSGNTIKIIRENPYRLYECHGVGFSTADSAARRLGVGIDDSRRVCAFILFTVTELCGSEGHMYVTTPQIKEHITKLFRRNSVEPFSHGEYLSDAHYYKALTELLRTELLVSDNDCIYLKRHWDNESSSADYLAETAVQPPRDLGDLELILAEFEQERGLTLSDEQRQAFFQLADSRVCIVSGYPGTGKTLLMSAFVHLFERQNLHYVLMSPTGIAAKRLSQVTSKPASTIHRALGYGRDGTWTFNRLNKFVVDAVIVDESSMLDSATFFHLVSALPSTTILVMVGDAAQLPSVGAGYVLQNLMHCEHLSRVSLTRIYRQSKQSDIVNVAHAILRGERIDTSLRRQSEFVFFEMARDQVIQEICKLTAIMKEKSSNFQVIAPMYAGDLGVDNLNIKLREVLNHEFISGRASKLKHGEVDMYEGDRVMVVKNDYDRMIFNGDTGKVLRIDLKKDEIEVKVFDWFDHESSVPKYTDKIFIYKVEEARHLLRVAYAVTCHRAQGNERDYIILPMTMQYGIMLYRNLIYTAITRAKKKVFLFGEPKALHYSVENNREVVRNSNLSSFISESMGQLRSELSQIITKPSKQAASI